MTEQPKTTSWLWSAGNGVHGVRIELNEGRLDWYDDLACACDGSTAEQTYADFRENGPAFSNPPQDVLDEMNEAIELLLKTEAS